MLVTVYAAVYLISLLVCCSYAQSSSEDHLSRIQTLVYQAQMGVKEEKVAALKDLVFSAIIPQYRELVIKAGALPVFVKLLQSGTFEAKFSACQAIGALTSDDTIRIQIGQSKAVENLHSLLRDNNAELKLASLQTLGNLMQDVVNQKRLLDIGGAATLTLLLAGGSDQMRRVAAGTIGNIGIHPEHIAALQDVGAVAKLVDMLRPSPTEPNDPLTVEVATGALRNLAQLDPPLQIMLEMEALDVLRALQDDGKSTSDTKELSKELIDFLIEYQQQLSTRSADLESIFREL